ncbi:hypothetical protein LCGC14_2732390 [marine sediment metagenome]|uniref:Uncharacterized protein n=1 Tax=marine sediment metagenome TaxID=412755 RepID=A0A0F9BFU1_9ZZZZ
MGKLGRKSTYLQALSCSPEPEEMPRRGCYFWGMVVAAGVSLLASRQQAKNAKAGLAASDRLSLAQAKALEAQEGRAAFFFAEFKNTFLPGERKLAAQAARGLDVERFTGEAVADVQQSFDKAEDIATRNLQRFGVNPKSGRFAGLNRKVELARASSEAGARTGTRRFIDDTNFQRRSAIANLGRGLPQLAVAAGRRGSTGAGQLAVNAGMRARDAGRTAEFIGRLPFDDLFSGRVTNTPTGAGATGNPNTSRNVNEFPSFQQGGLVGPEGGVVEAGEVVIPAEVVLAKGTEFFDKLKQPKGLPAQALEGDFKRIG